ncbi:MAG: molybdopterin-dependent oxidoreductase [Candidatus Promineifilaceae bacterium]
MSADPLQPHSHDNNLTPPDADESITLIDPDNNTTRFTLQALAALPQSQLIYSFATDHGTHGPYQLSGVALRMLVDGVDFQEVEVISTDGFGNRIFVQELAEGQPILLCTHSDGRPLDRKNGLIRLVVPSETDNALRQIKWVTTIRLVR